MRRPRSAFVPLSALAALAGALALPGSAAAERWVMDRDRAAITGLVTITGVSREETIDVVLNRMDGSEAGTV
ncbi:MAG: hypothetical protein VX463_14745, partial [Pseudomonadota bacterium]|nr:hypothetical protein [Pseudomonadota bacterium]